MKRLKEGLVVSILFMCALAITPLCEVACIIFAVFAFLGEILGVVLLGQKISAREFVLNPLWALATPFVLLGLGIRGAWHDRLGFGQAHAR